MEGTLEYANFRAWVPRNVLPVGTLNQQDWVYYDWGPRKYSEPLLCLHPVIGSAESFFHQVLSLAERGYRVIAPQLAVYWSAPEFCDGLHIFLDMLNIRRVHIYGGGIGGYLALQYAARRPDRVASVALTHAFMSTTCVHHKIVYSPSVLRWLPEFLVRNSIRSLFPKGRAEVSVAEAAEFSIMNTMTASRDELASRLCLLVTKSSVVGRLRMPENQVTIIDVVEYTVDTTSTRIEELNQAIPQARRALLKGGGDFPYLSCPEDVTMHLVVHMRRNATAPTEPLPLPPPAKPRQALFSHRRSSSTSVLSDHDTGSCDVEESIRTAAEERVAAAEAERLNIYSQEIAKIRNFVRDHDDEYLAAVLEDCNGDPERAVDRIRDGHYKKKFHMKARRKAVRRVIQEIKEEIGKLDNEQGASEQFSDNVTGVATPESLSRSPLAAVNPESELFPEIQETTTTDPSDREIGQVATERCEEESTLQNPNESGIENQSQSPFDGQGVDKMEVITQSRAAGEYTLDMRRTERQVASHSTSASEDEARRSDLGSGLSGTMFPRKSRLSYGRNSRLSSRDRYPPETDSVAAYVTSAKVGMQSNDKLIGRGPAPYPSARQDESRDKEKYGSVIGDRPCSSNFKRYPSLVHTSGDETGFSRDHSAMQVAEELNETFNRKNSFFADDNGNADSFTMKPDSENSTVLLPALHSDDETSGSISQSISRHDDGWGDFRRSNFYANDDDTVGAQAQKSGSHESVDSVDENEDESSRLREWMMSAKAATESVRRAPGDNKLPDS